MSEAAKPYIFRPFEKSDTNLIDNSWANSYYKGGRYSRFLSPEQFNYFHRPTREAFFKRKTATVLICCGAEHPEVICAWAAVEKLESLNKIILHYIYVKEPYRGEGLAKELLSKLNGDVLFTHKTLRAINTLREKQNEFKHFYYCPHLV